MVDLWPNDLNETTITPPIAILYEQAKLLSKHTRGLIDAEIVQDRESLHEFSYDFYLVAQQLGSYHYRLFTLTHPVELYPVTLHIGEEIGKELGVKPHVEHKSLIYPQDIKSLIIGGPPISIPDKYLLHADSEEKLIAGLGRILGSAKTRQILQSLLAQIKASPSHRK